MRLLLDTQIVVWWQTGDGKLGLVPRGLIESSEDTPLVSTASLWELAIKKSAGKIGIELPEFAQEVERLGFAWLPISPEHALGVAELPAFPDHKDPFDRLLVAQAKTEPLILLTADRRLARYGELVRVV